MTKIDPEFKAEWVAALRSGKYTQGQQGLVDANDNYCCLGVAVCLRPELVLREGLDFYMANQDEFQRAGADFPPTGFADLFLGGRTDPRIEVSDLPEKYGVNKSTGYDSDGYVSLSMLNDHLNKTFLEIADIIELCL